MADEEYIPYRTRPEWSDIAPVSQDDGDYEVVRIQYHPDFVDAHDYFRGVMAVGEKSQRALQLTADVINFNSANYTAWYYRKLILVDLGADLEGELMFCTEWGLDSPKNYQVWYHRRWLLDLLSAGVEDEPAEGLSKARRFQELVDGELEFVEDVLDDDSKNYNAWSHRQYIIERFECWEFELDFSNKMISEDIRNNSAWCHRFYSVKHSCSESDSSPSSRIIPIDVCKRELEYAMAVIRRAPNNESPWVYMSALFNRPDVAASGYDVGDMVLAFCEETKSAGQGGSPCRFALEMEADLLSYRGEFERSVSIYSKLGEVDRIRKGYYDYRARLVLELAEGGDAVWA